MSQPSPMPSKLSAREWAELGADVPGELVDGRLEEEELPTALHEAVAQWFLRTLASWVAARGGMAFGAELKFLVTPRRGRKADASVYLPGRALPGRSAGATRRPPSIVLEILSPRPRDVRRDTVDKLAEYAAFGATYYWLVDPLARTLEIRQLDPGGRHVSLLSAAVGTRAAPGCDGLELDLDGLWAEIDRLPDEPEE